MSHTSSSLLPRARQRLAHGLVSRWPWAAAAALAVASSVALLHAAPTTVTFVTNSPNWNNGSAADGEGGSADVPGVTLAITNISDTSGTPLPYRMLVGHAEYGDDFHALTTYDPAVNDNGWKGMQIAGNTTFQINGFVYWNWGASSPVNITVKGYRGGLEVASTSFNTQQTGFWQARTVTLDASFDNVDQVRLYSGGLSWHGINDLVIDAAVTNTAPTLGNLHGDTVSFIEGGTAIHLDAGSNATLTDSDSPDFSGGTLTAAIVANRVGAEDVLSIANEGTGVGQIGTNGATVLYGGTNIGSRTGGTGTADLVVTFNGNATAAAAQALVRALTYTNTNTVTPSTATRTVRVTANDGDGGTSNNADVSVTVTGVNDPPIISATGVSPTFTEDGPAVDLFSAVTVSTIEAGQTVTALTLTVTGLADGASERISADATSISLVNGVSGLTIGAGVTYSVVTSGSTATLTLGHPSGLLPAAAQSLIDGLTYSNAAAEPTGGARVVTLTSLRDDGGTSNGGVDTTILSIASTVTVVNTNDAPVVTTSGGTTAFTEADGVPSTPVVIDSGVTVADSDHATLPGATVGVTGNFQSGQDVLAFANVNPALFGNITASYNAGTGILTLTSAGATATLAQWQAALRAVTYTNTSDAPATATRTITFLVDDGAASSAAATKSVSVTAVNDTPVLTVPASVTVTEDVASPLTGLSIADADAGGASVTLTLSVPSGALAASSGGGVTSGGTSSARTLTGAVASINTFIAGGNVTFTTASHATAGVTLSIGIDDGGNSGSGGAKTASATTSLVVTAVNDAPVITAPASIAVTEDVATAVTGISVADVDAGSGAITLALSTATGHFSATSGAGVTVAGTGTTQLVLSGSMANINSFVASSQVTWTPSANSTTDVVLAVTADDGGNTGADPGTSGTATSEAATASVTFLITAVNDAPVNVVPGAQTVNQDDTLVFSASNGNAIGITDPDAGSSVMQVTLTASNGLITLAGTTGLSFTVGTGSADAVSSFEGSLTAINTALAAVTFQPTAGYSGPASLQVATSDLGHSGSGGAQTDTDTIAITVSPLAPVVTSASVTNADGGYKVGDTLTLLVTFDQAVTVDTAGGVPTLLLETGATDRAASYQSGSGTTVLAFAYTVQAGDASGDLDYVSTSALSFNGGAITSGTGTPAVLTLPMPGSAGSIAASRAIVVDGVIPAVASVSVPAAATYLNGQHLDFAVTWTESVVVDTSGGTPALVLGLDVGGPLPAVYLSGSGTATHMFRAVVQAGQSDADGLAVLGLTSNGGTWRDAVGNAANPVLQGVGATTQVHIDALAPSVTSVVVPAAGTYGVGQHLDLVVTWNEPVTVDTTGGTPAIVIGLDQGGPATAAYMSGSGTNSLLFRATVLDGQRDATGIDIGALVLNGGSVRDAVSLAADPTLVNVASAVGVLVDGEAPGISIGLPTPSSTARGPVTFVVTYSGADTVSLTAADVTLIATGTAAGIVTTTGTGAVRSVHINDITGVGTLAIAVAAGTATDAGGNHAPAAGPSVAVNVVAQEVTAVSPTSGLASGGVVVMVTGAGLDGIASPVVTIGGVPVRELAVVNGTTMRVVTPTLPAGAAVDVVVMSGAAVVQTLTHGYTPLARPDDQTADTDADGLPDVWELTFGLDPLVAADAALDPDGDGVTTLAEYAAGTHPRGTFRRSLAEGVVSDAFSTELTLFNPELSRASVVVRYLLDTATSLRDVVELEAHTRADRVAQATPGLSAGAFSTHVEADVPLVAEGMTTWDATAYGAGAEHAVTPAPTWYLAEGSTRGPFDLFYLLANPTETPVDVDVTFLRPAPAPAIVQRYTVAARGRATVWVDVAGPELADTDVSAVVQTVGGQGIVVERAMYAHDGSGRFGTAGHRAAGVPAAATTWHLAEGYVGGPFDTYLLVANPQAVTATIRVDVMGEAGVLATQEHAVAPFSRLTLHAGNFGLDAGPLAFSVHATNGQPVVVERAMWWRAAAGQPWIEAHASAGAPAGATRWGIADLRSGGARAESQYLLVQNVEAATAAVDVTVYTGEGALTRSYTVGATSRLTIDLAADFPAAANASSSAVIRSSVPVVVEASRYWDVDGVFWSAGVNVRGTPLP